ncbi:MAG: CDP-alcohol phosphatidyltransferase family protein [Candidatus Latescibacterota bacterium]|nr:CDP-alcohol phosphatidyltransferase family protein [Candidatus Latescibacterota bacterium]
MLANALSVSRIFLSLPLLYNLKSGDNTTIITVSILLAAAATDLADGFVARHIGNISRTGKMLDPLSDKIFLAALVGGLVAWHNFPLWLLMMLIIRDLCIVTTGCYLLSTRGFVIAANRWGKATTACIGLTTLSYIINTPNVISVVLLVFSSLLIITSSIAYVRTLRRTLRGVDETQVY